MTRRHLLALGAAAPVAICADDGYTSMFDGKTLRGWSVQNGPESAFYAQGGDLVIHEGSGFPTWLRFDQQLENFDFRCEFFIKGWSNGGIYLHAPEHGRPTWVGMKVNLFQKQDEKMLPESVGSIFPVVPPRAVNVKNKGEWNSMRIVMNWPSLKVWINGKVVQDLDVESVPDLKYRYRSGYLGIESLSYPLRFRRLEIRELPSRLKWDTLYASAEDLDKWTALDKKAKWEALGPVLRADGNGYLATKDNYRDFELQCYIRGSEHHNGGIIFRGGSVASAEHYEIQLHDVEGAVYPTGSLYHYQRAIYPRIQPEQWFPFQLIVEDNNCVVRINGDTVVNYNALDKMGEAPIMLQAHQQGRWIEYKQIRIRRL